MQHNGHIMKTRADIHYELLIIAYEYKMYDNLTQSEIDELADICASPSFRAIDRRFQTLTENQDAAEYRGMSYHQMMRPTIVFRVVDMERHLDRCRNFRVQAILRAWLRTVQDKLEYHSNYNRLMFAKLARAFPDMSPAELAAYYVANKMSILGDASRNRDISYMTRIFQAVHSDMQSPQARASAPITDRERLYASRWLEIFEQSTQGKNTNGKQR